MADRHDRSERSDRGQEPADTAGVRILTGYPLRCFLVMALRDANWPMTVAELTHLLEDSGLGTGGRPSKVVSDALRWEAERGRVRRIRRATYVFVQAPRTTVWRMRRRRDDLLDQDVGERRGRPPVR